MQLTAVYMQVPEGYVAFVEELPGANTQGKTLEEARANLDEAVMLVLEAKWAGGKCPINALPKGRTFSFSQADETLLERLEALAEGQTPAGCGSASLTAVTTWSTGGRTSCRRSSPHRTTLSRACTTG